MLFLLLLTTFCLSVRLVVSLRIGRVVCAAAAAPSRLPVLRLLSSSSAATQGDTEKLAIFGNTRARRGAELKVMAAVETKVPGYFTDRMELPDDREDGFGTRTLTLKVRVLAALAALCADAALSLARPPPLLPAR